MDDTRGGKCPTVIWKACLDQRRTGHSEYIPIRPFDDAVVLRDTRMRLLMRDAKSTAGVRNFRRIVRVAQFDAEAAGKVAKRRLCAIASFITHWVDPFVT